MNKHLTLFLLLVLSFQLYTSAVSAQTCSPEGTFVFTNTEGDSEEQTTNNYSGSAPVEASFTANPSDDEEYSARYEWRIYNTNDTSKVLVHRFDEDIQFTFTTSGTYTVELTATFQNGDDIVTYSSREEGTSISVTISESILEMPNGFSPNGDEYNPIYKAKDTHKSIVKFHATIFNRWGQKLYSWDDINKGWDGKVRGRYVKDGVYFVNVNAVGADGRVYHIRKDINVLTGFTNSESDTSTTEP